MASERDWAEGFLVQARADLEAARILITQNFITVARASVFAMLLQMAFEKFAKAALLCARRFLTAAAARRAGAPTLVAGDKRGAEARPSNLRTGKRSRLGVPAPTPSCGLQPVHLAAIARNVA